MIVKNFAFRAIICLIAVDAAKFKEVFNNSWIQPTQQTFIELISVVNTSHTSKSYVCIAKPDKKQIYQGELGLTKQFSDCYSKANGTTVVFYLNAGQSSDQFTITNSTNFVIIFNGVISHPADTTHRVGNMMFIANSSKFIIRSAHNKNPSATYYGLQGHGYPCFKNGTHGCGMVLIRAVNCSTFSINNLGLYDAGKFHLVITLARNAEFFNLRIWGQQTGGTDGMDISGENVYVHDVMVTNGDECVTTKNPAFNFLIEKILCSHSGGPAMGSLHLNTNISNIHYRYVHVESSTHGFLFKSFNGNGKVSNIVLENFVLRNMPQYSFYLNSFWGKRDDKSIGIYFKNIKVRNWFGNANYMNNSRHPTFKALCPAEKKCSIKVINYLVLDMTSQRVTYNCSNVLLAENNGCPKFKTSSHFPKHIHELPDSIVKGPWINMKVGEPINFPSTPLPYSYFDGMNATYEALSWGWNVI